MSDSPPTFNRRGGGQPGRRSGVNAATHTDFGLARPTSSNPPTWMTAQPEQAQFASVDQEIELLRISIRRLIEMNSQPQTVGDTEGGRALAHRLPGHADPHQPGAHPTFSHLPPQRLSLTVPAPFVSIRF